MIKQILFWLLNFIFDRLFNYVDRNKDGNLTQEEIKEFYDKIVFFTKRFKKFI